MRGPSVPLDPRTNVFRPDLADLALADSVIAARYGEPLARTCSQPFTMLHAAPAATSVAVSALLFGETFEVFDSATGWAWGRCGHDRYVGYVAVDALGVPDTAPTHSVTADALLFAAPDIKSPVRQVLPMGARLAVRGDDARFGETDHGFVHRRHIAPLALAPDDPGVAAMAAARQMIGAPYRWGGRTRGGIDCSGLVQLALMAAGQPAPRDSDMQAALGSAVAFDARAGGDLLCFPGHIGLLESPDTLLHANAFWMATVSEPLADVLARARSGQPDLPISIRRPWVR